MNGIQEFENGLILVYVYFPVNVYQYGAENTG